MESAQARDEAEPRQLIADQTGTICTKGLDRIMKPYAADVVEKDHPAMQTWIRITAGYRRIQGRWQIVHEDASVPFNPETGQAAFSLDLSSNT